MAAKPIYNNVFIHFILKRFFFAKKKSSAELWI